jgi:hypothetical protein
LGISIIAVRGHVRRICNEEDVCDVHALAEKLEFAVSPPLNQIERAGMRRFAVKEMMLRDCTQKEIMEKLSIDQGILQSDVREIYKMHGIKGTVHGGRRELAEKVGRPFVSRMEEIRKRVKEMREKGMNWKEIAREMGVSEGRMCSYRVGLKRVEGNAALVEESGAIAAVNDSAERKL